MKRIPKGAIASTVTRILKLAPSVRLIKSEVIADDKDYVESIRALLRRAESGQSVGVAYIEITASRTFYAKALGMADQNLPFCLGTVEVIKATLHRKVMG